MSDDRAKPTGPAISRKRKLAFLAMLLLVSLGLVELLLQAYYYVTAGDFLFRRSVPPIYESDATRCFRLKPDLDYLHRTNEFSARIVTNSQGFRTDGRRAAYSYEKEKDVFRVLFLGPSFAMGWASDYPETYASLIERQLAVDGRRVELINLGTPSQSAEQQLCWLVHEGYKFQPDLIVQTSYGREVGRLPHACPESLSCPEVSDGLLYTATPSLGRRIAHGVKNLALVFYGYYAFNAVTGSSGGNDVGVGKELYSDRERAAVGDDYADLVGDFATYLGAVRRAVGATTEVVFIHIPLSFVVHPQDVSRWSHIVDADPAAARAATRRGVEALHAAGVKLVDATPHLIDAAAGDRMYHWLDIHLTPAGNRVVADAAIPALEEWINEGADNTPAP